MASNFLTRLKKAGQRKEDTVYFPERKTFEREECLDFDSSDLSEEEEGKLELFNAEQDDFEKAFDDDQDAIERESFLIRDITGAMRDYWDGDNKKRVKFKGKHPDLNTLNTKGQRGLLVAMTLVDDDNDSSTFGDLAFNYKDEKDINELSELSGELLDFLFDKSLGITGLKAEAEKAAEKN